LEILKNKLEATQGALYDGEYTRFLLQLT